jgi:hypothetical protein
MRGVARRALPAGVAVTSRHRLLSLLVASTALVTVPLAAQTGFGLVGGITRSQLATESDTYDNHRTGLALGLTYVRSVHGRLQFAPELLYIQKGFGIPYGTSTFGPTVSVLELPLLLRAQFGAGALKPFLLGGLAPALKLSCTYSTDGTTSGSTACDTDPSVDTRFQRFDFGAVFGAGLAYSRFSMSVRYDVGLVDIITDNGRAITSKNRSLMLLGGVSF